MLNVQDSTCIIHFEVNGFNRTLADPYALFSVMRYDSMRNLILRYRLRWKSPLIELNLQN